MRDIISAEEQTVEQPAEDEAVEEIPEPPTPEFWSDADIANSASTAITGSRGDSFIGYTAASTAAATDSLTNIGIGSGNIATFDMSLGGNNTFVAGSFAAYSSGSIAYTGGSGADNLTFGDLAYHGGSVTFDMSLGGDNTFAARVYGSIDYTGGAGVDSLTLWGNIRVKGMVLQSILGTTEQMTQ